MNCYTSAILEHAAGSMHVARPTFLEHATRPQTRLLDKLTP